MSNNAKYTVMFPLTIDTTSDTGYDSIGSDNLHELVNFNIKNVLLTNRGERKWAMSFGVGLHQLLFQSHSQLDLEVLEDTIRSQIDIYVPYIYLNDVDFRHSPDQSVLGVRLRYTIAQVNTSHVLEITVGGLSNNKERDKVFGSEKRKADISERLIGDLKSWWQKKEYAIPEWME